MATTTALRKSSIDRKRHTVTTSPTALHGSFQKLYWTWRPKRPSSMDKQTGRISCRRFSPDKISSSSRCSLTCGLFANLLINQGQVRTLVAGGRPNNQPMAMIGGVQGAEDLRCLVINQIATDTLKIDERFANASDANSATIVSATQLIEPLTQQPPINVDPHFLDNIAQGVKSETPLQFTRAPNTECSF